MDDKPYQQASQLKIRMAGLEFFQKYLIGISKREPFSIKIIGSFLGQKIETNLRGNENALPISYLDESDIDFLIKSIDDRIGNLKKEMEKI